MPHEIERVLAAAGRGPWFIAPEKAVEIAEALALRAALGPRPERAHAAVPAPALSAVVGGSGGMRSVRVVRLMGAIVPRGNMLADVSGAVSLERFGAAFREAAADPQAAGIVVEMDSPGGQIDLVPETAAMMRAARRADRPVVAVANTLAASAAYWLASACDEIVVTPSGLVGSIGVYLTVDDLSGRMQREGIKRSFISEGPRKVEASPFAPLDDAARAHLQAQCRAVYEMFTRDVAKARGVPVSVVQADPEAGGRHMGGGRAYRAAEAVRLGMADRVATLEDTIARLARGPGRSRPLNAAIERRRLALD